MYRNISQIAKLFLTSDQVKEVLLYKNEHGVEEIIVVSDGEYPTPGMIFATMPYWIAFLSWLSYSSSGDIEYHILPQCPEKIICGRFWMTAKLLGIRPEGKVSFFPVIWLFPSFWREKESVMRSSLGKYRNLYDLMLQAHSLSASEH